MEDQNHDYHFSLFKPKTPYSRANRNLIIWFVSIWAVAIFGFQVLLKVVGKPTPESSYLVYEKVWPQIESGTASQAEIRDFADVSLSVLGKIAIKPEHKDALDNALCWSVLQLAGDSLQKAKLMTDIVNFEKMKAEITDIQNPEYVAMKKQLGESLRQILSLESTDVRSTILPLEMNSAMCSEFLAENKEKIPSVMELYLIHNQSFLTKAKFLGFPFHYFYTAFFLLVLFVLICLIYSYRTDKLVAKYNVNEN